MLGDSTQSCSLIDCFDAVEYLHVQNTGATVVQLQMPHPVRILT